MKAAVVFEPGRTPIYGDFQELAGDGEVRIHITASALSPLTRRALLSLRPAAPEGSKT